MATKTTEFDAAKHLISPGSQAELLCDALESGDAGYIANAIEFIARAWRWGYERGALQDAWH
jgi:DNA-binding phage protein